MLDRVVSKQITYYPCQIHLVAVFGTDIHNIFQPLYISHMYLFFAEVWKYRLSRYIISSYKIPLAADFVFLPRTSSVKGNILFLFIPPTVQVAILKSIN